MRSWQAESRLANTGPQAAELGEDEEDGLGLADCWLEEWTLASTGEGECTKVIETVVGNCANVEENALLSRSCSFIPK